ncbi:T9SS type A sorting domain-containing protein [Tenacibaculum agarivorans]|uniref:T9SS type A sorting domain-containing protein n=1 Tax=Tenacibaculum agarivorans TaxID=1908389 RepID=UPI00094BB2D3|nr:T9SS type A sorting domain-containing protein [Tenacibaculum agarivorans]
MRINNVAFKANNSVLSVDDFTIASDETISNYPNPFRGQTTITLAQESDKVTLLVYDILGRAIFNGDLETNSNRKEVVFNLQSDKKGMFKYIVVDSAGLAYKGTLVAE